MLRSEAHFILINYGELSNLPSTNPSHVLTAAAVCTNALILKDVLTKKVAVVFRAVSKMIFRHLELWLEHISKEFSGQKLLKFCMYKNLSGVCLSHVHQTFSWFGCTHDEKTRQIKKIKFHSKWYYFFSLLQQISCWKKSLLSSRIYWNCSCKTKTVQKIYSSTLFLWQLVDLYHSV